MYQAANRLVEEVLRGAGDHAANALLNEFFCGYSIENLRPLLGSSEEAVIRAAVWIASELGVLAKPLLGEFYELLNHPLGYVRFFSLDVVLVCAAEGESDLLGRAVQLIQDREDSVRWKALVFLSRASVVQLKAASQSFPVGSLSPLVNWLANLSESTHCCQDIKGKLIATNGMANVFAAAGAYRLYRFDASLLNEAANSSNPEVASFAAEQLRLMQ